MKRTSDTDIDGIDVTRFQSYLSQTEVTFALLFGSHARGTATPTSDVDIVLHFPDQFDARERFQRRNRIDADLQAYAAGFVDVSDIEQLPLNVVHSAVRDGILLVGDETAVDDYRTQIEQEYDATADERKRERQEFINRLASGDV
ncbi:nucleotidyltransferase domain-containing protein [Haladaptatus sp. AB618]|uniref:type VII toxin-antitoxin system MntA family adenylyltransferase antitoxin n=1 Tax=Haladaptatus sp. AB618 TaxID=2934173 RepID=UPI00209BE1B0|nr:nucleotidyltransferase domain-containing protein [Haladaptatus sp. AB618]MCO8255779.1 nucleotidyltransferase domain-containing protein [Haladaptatus sp. AB618]